MKLFAKLPNASRADRRESGDAGMDGTVWLREIGQAAERDPQFEAAAIEGLTTIERLIKARLMVGTPEDVAGHEVQHSLDRFGDALNSRPPLKLTGVGHLATGLAKVDKAVEHLTFGFLQTGFKINVASAKFERLVGKGVSQERAARLAASYANDIFGSLDYYRVTTDTDSHIMRKLGTASLNQSARRVLQLALFAPDWTISMFRTMAKAMPGGSADSLAMQMHRRYMIKAAIYYFTVANAVNYALSGHSLFQNKNPTRIDLDDGRTMQFSKHETEPLEWLRDPVQTGENKLGILPAAALRVYRSHQVAKDHRTPTPTMIDDAELVSGGFAPISLQQYVQQGFTPRKLYNAHDRRGRRVCRARPANRGAGEPPDAAHRRAGGRYFFGLLRRRRAGH